MKAPIGPFFITGEIGKPISAAPVSLESIGAKNTVLDIGFCETDMLTWFQPKATGTPPAVDQTVSLFDSTGRRLFMGMAGRSYKHDTGGRSGYMVTVKGPYDWLKKTPIESLVADADGVMAMRPQVTFPTQPLGVTITQLFQMARDLGAPLRLAPLPAWFPVTRMTYPKDKFGEALEDILKWVADAGGRFLYDVEGPPQFLIERRSEAKRVLIELEAESNYCEKIEMEAVPDMRPTCVSVQSVVRDPVTFKPKFVTATAGEPTGPAYRRQLVVTSGPENNTLLPQDVYESDTVQTAAAVAWNWVKATDPQIAAAITNFGDVTLSAATGTTYGAQSGSGGTIKYYTDVPPRIYDSNGNVLIGSYRLVTGGIPEWVTKDYGIQKVEAFLRGQFGGWLFFQGTFGYADLEAFSPTLQALKDEGRLQLLSGYPPGGPYTNIQVHGWITVDLPITVINVNYPIPETLWRKQDYDFLFPPENLHRDLWDAQNFTPWKGQGRMLPGAPILPAPGELLNVMGGDPDWETANARIQSLRLELDTGHASFQVGTPPAQNVSTLLDRFRRASSDNVTARA